MKRKTQTTAAGRKHLRIQIKDLPKDMKVSQEEMRTAMGGSLYSTSLSTSYLRLPLVGPGTVGQSGGGCGCGCG